MTVTSTAFDQNTLAYDNWFEKHAVIYQSELLAVQQVIPPNKTGIEIEVGTGRFSQPLNIKFGVEPSENMARLAEQRGIEVYHSVAESLPIENKTFDFALMVTTVCFLSDIPKAFAEFHRILKANGEFILAIIEKNSELGKKYLIEIFKSKFYKEAQFYSTEEVSQLLRQSNFHSFSYWQTLTSANTNAIEQPQNGFGKGGGLL